MSAILSYISAGVFEPEDVDAMSLAYEEICTALHIHGDAGASEAIAVRVIDLARGGERSPAALRDRVLAEANAGLSVLVRARNSLRRMIPRTAAAPLGIRLSTPVTSIAAGSSVDSAT